MSEAELIKASASRMDRSEVEAELDRIDSGIRVAVRLRDVERYQRRKAIFLDRLCEINDVDISDGLDP
jgi:hypothetical protein